MDLVRELQTPTQRAAAEVAAEPEAEQEGAGKIRDTREVSAEAATPSLVYATFVHPPGWKQWGMN